MSYIDIPYFLWGYALQTDAYILNRVPSKAIFTTPYQIWFGRNPSLKHLKIWGCPTYVRITQRDKLAPRGYKFRFVGYPDNSMGYQFHDSEQ